VQTSKWSAAQSIKEHEISSPSQNQQDFRAVFRALDPAALITAGEFAALLCVNAASIEYRLKVGRIPRPVVRENRCVRWRVSDVREWLEAM
jgi:predicted DNA-binding transcriptional regulator AlpA